MILRRTAAAVLTAMVATSGAVAATSSPASAAPSAERVAVSGKATPGCVTRPEFRALKKGMTIAQVKRITGTNGVQTSRTNLGPSGILFARGYKTCTRKGGVGISFIAKGGKPARLEYKTARFR